jgi:hypothetical protein
VIDAFRLINRNILVLGQEPRQATSNLGHLEKPSITVSKTFLCFYITQLLLDFRKIFTFWPDRGASSGISRDLGKFRPGDYDSLTP